jgi:cell wall-associated NlpC family hydrolase
MRTTEIGARAPRCRCRPALSLAAAVGSLALVLAGTTPALADPDLSEPAADLPSVEEVREARTRAVDAEVRVAQLQSGLALANQQLEAAAVEAEQASEAYNGARWQVEQTTRTLRQARGDARRADRQVAQQRERLAGVVASSYQTGGDVSAVNAVLGAEGPAGVMSQMLAFEGASSSLDSRFQEFSATATLADVFREEARDLKAAQVELLAQAEAAREAAVEATDQAQRTATELARARTGLVRELAQLQGISVQLAEKRQRALEELQRQRTLDEAAENNPADNPADTPEDAPTDESSPVAPTQPAQPAEPAQPAPPQPAQPVGPPSTTPPSTTPPPATAPPVGGGAAARTIAFARAQLGEPYVWGAAGPGSWDCSGLTMAAWQAGGVSLPHYSVAQYDATTPISASQLRPGDLVFWGSSSSPGSIHHVALYIGDGMILHAPRTGRPVAIDSMYYWVPPNFFGRV